MAKVVEILKNNNENFFKLRKLGVRSLDTLTDYYSIYQVYLGYSNIKKKMLRRTYTAEKTKVSEGTVERVVALMEKVI